MLAGELRLALAHPRVSVICRQGTDLTKLSHPNAPVMDSCVPDDQICQVYLHSIRHRCPLGSVKAIISGSMSSSDIPSNIDIRAAGKARKKQAVARRNSVRARWTPRHTEDRSAFPLMNHEQSKVTGELNRRKMTTRQIANDEVAAICVGHSPRAPPPQTIITFFISGVAFPHRAGSNSSGLEKISGSRCRLYA